MLPPPVELFIGMSVSWKAPLGFDCYFDISVRLASAPRTFLAIMRIRGPETSRRSDPSLLASPRNSHAASFESAGPSYPPSDVWSSRAPDRGHLELAATQLDVARLLRSRCARLHEGVISAASRVLTLLRCTERA